MILDDIDVESGSEYDLEKGIPQFLHLGHGRRISNGPLEGKNNYIQKILSNANGYRNFNRARNKIMFSQNLHNEYDSGFSNLYIVDKILNNRKQKAK